MASPTVAKEEPAIRQLDSLTLGEKQLLVGTITGITSFYSGCCEGRSRPALCNKMLGSFDSHGLRSGSGLAISVRDSHPHWLITPWGQLTFPVTDPFGLDINTFGRACRWNTNYPTNGAIEAMGERLRILTAFGDEQLPLFSWPASQPGNERLFKEHILRQEFSNLLHLAD